MTALWDDRLAEVWAQPGKAGAGVVIGAGSVLTARHIIADALKDIGGRTAADGGTVKVRIVQPGGDVDLWVDMTVRWHDPTWDLALLEVDRASDSAISWHTPTSPIPAFVALGTSVESACECIGFPDSAVQRAPDTSATRQTEQCKGDLLPGGQGKKPMNASRNLPPSWMPFDISTSTSEGQAEWEGMSGAGVVLPSPDGRLCGVIVAAEAGHQQRRLYAVRLSTALEKADGLADAVAAVTGHPTVVEHRQAAGFRAALRRGCLGSGGAPRLLGEVSELGAFGVKAADLPGEPTHLDYVPREQDDDLRRTLAELAEVGGPPRMLLVVGASAAGKTRSAAEAVRYVLPQHRLLIPRYDSLARVLALPIVNDAPVVVWLDDVERYAHGAFRDNVERLLGYGAVVVATIRRAQLDVLDAPGDLRNPTGEALSDPDFATRVDWQLQWTAEERGRIVDHAAYQPLLAAVAKGISLGAYCVAGPQLVERVQSARTDDERPWRYTLVRNALDWYRTGIGHALPFDVARRLMAEAQMDGDPDSDEWEDALTWCKTPVIGAGRQSRQSVLSTPSADSLNVHDFVLDHDERNEDRAVPDEVWTAVLETASTNDQLFDIAAAAFQQHRTDVATAATMPLAAEGIVTAMYNLGLLLAESDPVTARHWYEQAAEHGNSDAMRNLGLLLAESDPVTARHWYEQAAKHGNSDAALNLMLLPEEADPLTARHKYEQAPEAGDSNADTALRELDG